MPTTARLNGPATFRLRRPVPGLGAAPVDVDRAVHGLLDQLADLLNKQCFTRRGMTVPRQQGGRQGGGGKPRAGSGQSGTGQSGTGQSGTGQSGSIQPASGQSASGQPASGQPASGQPASGQPASGQPASGQSGSGQSSSGHLGRSSSGSGGGACGISEDDLPELLAAQLSPRRSVGGQGWWAQRSLLERLAAAPDDQDLTLADIINSTPELSELRYAAEAALSASWYDLDSSAKVVLQPEHVAIRDYLVAYAFHVMKIRELAPLRTFVLQHPHGVRRVVQYLKVSAAREVIRQDMRLVPDYDDDDSAVVREIRKADLPLSSAFHDELDRLVDDVLYNADELEALNGSTIRDTIPESMVPRLLGLIKGSAVTITKDNIDLFLPHFVSHVSGLQEVDGHEARGPKRSPEVLRGFFDDDEGELSEVDRSAVETAAHLYSCMVLDEEIRLFDVVAHFTHRHLVRERYELEDGVLRDDLRRYVFSQRFRLEDETQPDEYFDRTRPAERQMFYRQVFAHGSSPVNDAVIVNEDFPPLWKVLMIESANYLERARLSPNPDNFVSPQGVMQAVEDLQYNLSLHCTGMVRLVAPLILGEMNFLKDNVLTHPEVVGRVVRRNRPRMRRPGRDRKREDWRPVVEELYAEMAQVRPPMRVIANKAKYGEAILQQVAEYDPLQFEDPAVFSGFISLVDAYIKTQSILQRAAATTGRSRGRSPVGLPRDLDDLLPDGLVPGGALAGNGFRGYPGDGAEGSRRVPESVGAPAEDGAEDDEWDF